MKKILSIALVLVFALTAFVGCAEKEPFEVVSCGSGFYFNRSVKDTFKIKELDATSDGNYFYIDDYFYSETLGDEYTVKKGFFKAGTVYLAKKSDHYNPEVFRFDISQYNNRIIAITPEMNYVELYSSVANESSNVQIQIFEGRTTPIDLTFDNINIYTENGIPAIFSAAATDVNFILKGENTVIAGAQHNTVNDLLHKLQNNLFGDQVESYYEALGKLEAGKDAMLNSDVGGALEHFFNGITDLGKGVVDGLLDGADNLLNGVEGLEGAAGPTCIILPAGLSVAGEGTLMVCGGNGAGGTSATYSLTGQADGGDGGDGGDGILCGAYLNVASRVDTRGGYGGRGGEGSKGLFGSGDDGDKGSDGVGLNVANPKTVNGK